ncbi:hypothetical protein HELRODRAFT_84403 [Helobdella robusta]|uniref:Aromatic-L-amino-acid decarboxylase n=1 Tax=Helobdella robusta TaxID=6412 RepID=T1G5I4_HELRO|nr:hypothetical protein HELRODRAFT_84403 [Helobdella robusta]ESN98404.1 hypothetical protein HELRODRAFT_84403 [Helobdella robusta]
MDSKEFRRRGREMVDYIADYFENIEQRRVFPDVQPGYLKELVPSEPPQHPDSWDNIMNDITRCILPGITNWQHPHFHAYFPSNNSYPSMLAEFLVDAFGAVCFSWASCPASTELEVIVMDWIANMIALPKKFLHSNGVGGGVTQSTASECILISMLVARHKALKNLSHLHQNLEPGVLLDKLVAYRSKYAHSCAEKTGMLSLVKMRELDVDEKFSLRGNTLEKAIQEDKRNGLVPFYVFATLGTTSVVSFDNIKEIGEVCSREKIWLHVDAAYAGSAFVCPEFRVYMEGIENVQSFDLNPQKWMLMNAECSALWIDDKEALIDAMTVDPLYLQHNHSDKTEDFRHWSVTLGRRFRSLKMWAVLRSYGVTGLQNHIKNHCKMAKYFETLMLTDARFQIVGQVTLGLVCFKLRDNQLTEKLLSSLNSSGKMHLVPAAVNDDYIIRFAVCFQKINEDHIRKSWEIIRDTATKILNDTE